MVVALRSHEQASQVATDRPTQGRKAGHSVHADRQEFGRSACNEFQPRLHVILYVHSETHGNLAC